MLSHPGWGPDQGKPRIEISCSLSHPFLCVGLQVKHLLSVLLFLGGFACLASL